VRGLSRLLGTPRAIGQELRREAASRGVRVHVAIAPTRMAALVLSLARPGLTVVGTGGVAEALAPISLTVLEQLQEDPQPTSGSATQGRVRADEARLAIAALKRWGLRTLGELAALPAADLSARLGRGGRVWQAIARGEDTRPLVPMQAEERFEGTLDLEWPIEGAEPLSFVLTRLLEPLSTRLERRDRGTAVLHVALGLVTREVHACRLELPSPLRDVRALRTLALLDFEAHPPSAAIDRVTVTIEPTPGRILQHTLFARPHPTPEQLSTLLARLGALMGQDRIGAPALVDTHRPGAFAMTPFAIEHAPGPDPRSPIPDPVPVPTSVLRRCRHPVPARVNMDRTRRPLRVSTERRGFAGGAVLTCAGPWRTSGAWWEDHGWSRDEWEVALDDGAVYRIFRDRVTDGWFIDGVLD
jgi:protein ImuB